MQVDTDGTNLILSNLKAASSFDNLVVMRTATKRLHFLQPSERYSWLTRKCRLKKPWILTLLLLPVGLPA